MEINKVFVYGTLMSGMHNHRLVKPFIKHLEMAKTLGRLYDLPYGYPAMIGGQEEIWGEILEIEDVKKALKVLDRLEGYSRVESPRNLYNRTVQEIQTLSSKAEKAYVYYWANPDTLNQLGTRIKHSWRNTTCFANYISSGFKPTTEVYEEELKRGAVVLPEPYRTSVFLHAIKQCAIVRDRGPRDEKEDIITALRFFRSSPTRESVFMLANALHHKLLMLDPFIQKLIDIGYIRQDSRDTEGPYGPGATYYTLPAKRAEIDQLLRADKLSSIISNELH